MAIINLREYYPFYTSDLFIEVSDEVEAALSEAKRQELNYMRQVYRNKAHYSLNVGDGIESEAVFISVSPCEVYERKMTKEQLYSALASLSDKQRQRVYAHYILGMSKQEIANAESIREGAVRESISRGLVNLEKYLKNL